MELAVFLYRFVELLFDILTFAIIARAFISWFNVGPDNPLVKFLYDITEPILGPLRRIIPSVGMFDISPIVALLLIRFVREVLLSAIARLLL